MSDKKPARPRKPRPRKPRPAPTPESEPSSNGVGYHIEVDTPPAPAPKTVQPVEEGTRADRIIRSDIDWIVPGFVAEDLVTLVTGPADVGKTTWMAAIGSYVTGGDSPYGRCGPNPARVLWLTAEEDPGRITVPKLMAAGASLSRVLFPLHDQFGSLTNHLSLPSQMRRLDDMVLAFGARLLVLDPISSFLDSSVDESRKEHVRPLIQQLSHLAHRHGLAILATVHNRKSRNGGALDRVGGSAAWTQVPRLVVCLGEDPDDAKCKVLAVGRCSFGPPAGSVRYKIVDRDGVGRWERLGESDASAHDLGSTPTELGDRGSYLDARAFLVALLDEGEQKARDVMAMAENAGISPHALRKAKDALGVEFAQVHDGLGNYWVWRKPANGWPK